MTLDALLPLPPEGFDITSRYRLKPRPKRAFHTILDVNKLLVPGSKGSLAFRSVDDRRIELVADEADRVVIDQIDRLQVGWQVGLSQNRGFRVGRCDIDKRCSSGKKKQADRTASGYQSS